MNFYTALAFLKHFLRQSVGAILDQGLFALANFLINLLLVRWTSPAEYGAFSIAYSALLLLNALYTALFVEPMLVFGASKYRNLFPAYIAVLLTYHKKMGVLLFVMLSLISVTATAFIDVRVGLIAMSLAVSSPMILLLWLARRTFYVMASNTVYSVIASASYGLLSLLGIYILHQKFKLTVEIVLVLMGISSLAAGVLLFRLLPSHRNKIPSSQITERMVSEVIKDHLSYARWSIPSSLFTWMPSNLYYILLPLWSGVEASGILRALMNVIMPALQANAALAMLFVATFSRKASESNSFIPFRTMFVYLLTVISASSAFSFLVALLRRDIISELYGSYYEPYSDLLLILGLIPILTATLSVIGAVIRALRKPDVIFWAYFFSSAFSLLLGIALFARLGVLGGALGILAAYVLVLVYLMLAYIKLVRLRS